MAIISALMGNRNPNLGIAGLLTALAILPLAAFAQGFNSISGASAPARPGAQGPAVNPSQVPVAAPTQGFSSVSTMPAKGPPAATASAAIPAAAISAVAGAFASVSGMTAAPASGEAPRLDVRGGIADKVLVKKSERQLYLMRRGQVIAQYPIKLGLNPFGHKQREGDFRTPEGRYELIRRNPSSRFFLSIEISYPNREDRAVASEAGYPPGGLIMIHGQPNEPTRPPAYYASKDWTDGCIAVSNADMIDIWNRAPLGIPIEIRP
ncbi:MAG TPA: L,D-transpeptidase family protein [Steroidobacteraceae bacterium]|nr:L,D-transpeptidase family protein [Steroidobacteraceae bacterium]